MMSAESNSEKSVSYQKKDGRGHARPFFFWYDNDKDLKVCFIVTRLICHHQSWYRPCQHGQVKFPPCFSSFKYKGRIWEGSTDTVPINSAHIAGHLRSEEDMFSRSKEMN